MKPEDLIGVWRRRRDIGPDTPVLRAFGLCADELEDAMVEDDGGPRVARLVESYNAQATSMAAELFLAEGEIQERDARLNIADAKLRVRDDAAVLVSELSRSVAGRVVLRLATGWRSCMRR